MGNSIKSKIFIYLFLLIMIALAVLLFFWLSGNAGKWLPNPPSIPSIATSTVQSGTLKGQYREIPSMIVSSKPKIGAGIESPVLIEGKARGGWYFEGTFPVSIRDGNGNEIGYGFATTKGDWTTNDFVPFTAEIEYSVPSTERGKIILERDDPSGESIPEYIEIPVFFKDTK